MSNVRIDWRGDELYKKARSAQVAGIDATLEESVKSAKANHGWKNVTGAAEASIEREPARDTSRGAAGRIGSTLDRFKYLEIGVRGRSGDNTIRRSGDATFPKLFGWIKKKLKAALG